MFVFMGFVFVFPAQDVLLGLVQQFAQHKMSAQELQKVLQLFQHSDIPMVSLENKSVPAF